MMWFRSPWELVYGRAVEKFGEVGYRGSSAINRLVNGRGGSSEDQKAVRIMQMLKPGSQGFRLKDSLGNWLFRIHYTFCSALRLGGRQTSCDIGSF